EFTRPRDSKERQPDDRLHVHDLAAADHVAHVADLERLRLDVFVLVRRRLLVCLLESRQPEEHHFLIAVARCRKQRAKADDRRRHHANLLVTLSARGLFWRLSLVYAAGRQLPERPVDGITILLHQREEPRLGHRQEYDRSRMPYDVDGDFPSVRHAYTIPIDV